MTAPQTPDSSILFGDSTAVTAARHREPSKTPAPHPSKTDLFFLFPGAISSSSLMSCFSVIGTKDSIAPLPHDPYIAQLIIGLTDPIYLCYS
jgi:hypothetical protein